MAAHQRNSRCYSNNQHDFPRAYDRVNIDHTKRHKFDGVMCGASDSGTNNTIMLVEFAGGFGVKKEEKKDKDTVKLYRNAFRVLNETNSKVTNSPCIYTVLSYQQQIYFEVLAHVDNSTYTRTRWASIILPTTAEELKAATAELPKLFAWRDRLLQSAENLSSDMEAGHDSITPASTP